MMWYTHIVSGLLVAAIFLTFVDVSSSPVFIMLVLFASLLPDIDQKDAHIHRYLPFTRWIQSIFEHRGFFHSVFPALLLFVFPFSFGFWDAGAALLLGYCSHLIADGITPTGIYPFYPVKSVHLRGFVKVGGLLEMILFGVMVGLAAIIILNVTLK
ncbi:metal-dependent hydrolase [Candidatus Woesearchaeota archaeon]|nr:metal-dependent hydrolase [Candidatus Woesearchaeota archaeon]